MIKCTLIDTKGLASSGAEATGNLFRKFKDNTSSAFEKTKSKTDQVADSTNDHVKAAWQDKKDATQHVASKTKQKSNEAFKSAEQSANFLGNICDIRQLKFPPN